MLAVNNMWRWLKERILWLSIPFQKWIQRRGRREPLMTDEQVEHIISLVQPGDILLSFEYQRFTSLFIKGFYDHAVLVDGSGKRVIEAVGDKWYYNTTTGEAVNIGGVRDVGLIAWLYKKDYVALIRPVLPILGGAEMNRIAGTCARGYIGRSYDYIFKYGDEQVYCSELPYVCYNKIWKGFLADTGDGEILPQCYYDKCFTTDYLVLLADTKNPEKVSGSKTI